MTEWDTAWDNAIDLLKIMQAYDQRTVGEPDIEAWAVALLAGRWDIATAREAVARHYLESDKRIMPAHVSVYCRARNAERIEQAASRHRERQRALPPPHEAETRQTAMDSIRRQLATAGRMPAPASDHDGVWERAVRTARAPRDALDGNALSVACPHCGAVKWRSCTVRNSHGLVEVRAHPSRLDALEAARRGDV